MTKVMKKLACVLMAIMMVAVMMPAMAFADDGAYTGFTAYVNGSAANTVSVEWMKKNAEEPQIFPFASSQGKEWGYMIVEGPAFDAVLVKALGISKLGELDDNVQLRWANAALEEQGKFDLSIAQLKAGTTCFKLVDENGNEVTSAFDAAGKAPMTVKAAKLEGAKDLTPVVAFRESKTYATYAEAKKALDDNSWTQDAVNKVRAFVGGDLNAAPLKKDGEVKMGSANFNGKWAMTDLPVLLVKGSVAPAKVTSLKAKNSAKKTVKVTWKKTASAVGYEVSYKKAGAKKWTVKTTTKTSLTVKKLTKGKKYSFKVRAYNKNAEGAKTFGKSTKTVSVTIKK